MKKIYIGNPIKIDKDQFNDDLIRLAEACQNNDIDGIEETISRMVPTFNHKTNKK